MTAINFAFTGLSGYVTHGNSLTADATATWKIDPTRGFDEGPIQEVDPIAVTGSTATDKLAGTTPQSPTTNTSHQRLTIADQLMLSAFDEGPENK